MHFFLFSFRKDIRNLRDRKNKKKTSSSAKNDRILRQKSSKVNKRSAAVSAGLRLCKFVCIINFDSKVFLFADGFD